MGHFKFESVFYCDVEIHVGCWGWRRKEGMWLNSDVGVSSWQGSVVLDSLMLI